MTASPAAKPSDDAEAPAPWLEEMPPRQIVAELDRYIVGQDAAKKAVAIAVRNRWRRAQAPDDIRDEITPYNIIMIGPTGVGKTEVARRLARLAGAPFLKVEASKFTEVGYVGRDAESRADERLLDLLLPAPPAADSAGPGAGRSDEPAGQQVFVVSSGGAARAETPTPEEERRKRSREKLRQLLADGKLDERDV